MYRFPHYIADYCSSSIEDRIANTEATLAAAKEEISNLMEDVEIVEKDLAALKTHRDKLQVFMQTGRFPVWTRTSPGYWAENTWRTFNNRGQQ